MGTVYYLHLIVTIWLYFVLFLSKSEILVENRDFFLPSAFDASVKRSPSPSEYTVIPFWCGKTRKKLDDTFRHNTGV